jgi:hypothetical protein
LIGPTYRGATLDPVGDRYLVEEFVRQNRHFSFREARKTKRDLLERRFSLDKINHLLMCWWKLKLLRDSYSRHRLYKEYLYLAYDKLFFPEHQEEYSDFLDHIVGQGDDIILQGRTYRITRPTQVEGAKLSSIWDRFFILEKVVPEPEQLGLEAALPLSMFPMWDIQKPSKTDTLCDLPLKLDKLEDFKLRFRALLEKYSPDRLFVPTHLSCYKPGGQRYNDAGKVRRDYEIPENWNCGFKFQRFLTGPLSPREVWLPDKATKLSNSFWFPLCAQIIRRIPYYANNYTTAEELHNSIKHKLQGNCVIFDVSGFGLQFQRQYLEAAIDEIAAFYDPNPALLEGVKEIKQILSEVWLEMPDGRFKKPARGIGLGYYESLKTLCVCAILDHTNPISLFGDQGLIPGKGIALIRNHPRTILSSHGFVFTDPLKARILPDIETGILYAGYWITPTTIVAKKEYLSKLSGALDGMYHWERKLALESISLPVTYQHIWKYLSFQYEIVFGYEFFKTESMYHPSNLGVDQTAPEEKGNIRALAVTRLNPPRNEFTSYVHKLGLPTRKGISLSLCKDFSIKRSKVWKASLHKTMNTYYYEMVHPKVVPNHTQKAHVTEVASATPMWQAVRLLLLEDIDTGTISRDLPPQQLIDAVGQYPHAENPYEVKATGGYRLDSLYVVPRGHSDEGLSLSQLLIEAKKNMMSYVFRKDTKSIPPSYAWDDWIDQTKVRLKLQTAVKEKNPYLLSMYSSYLAGGETPPAEEPASEPSIDLSSMVALINKQTAQSDESEVEVEHQEFSLLNTWGEEEGTGDMSVYRLPEPESPSVHHSYSPAEDDPGATSLTYDDLDEDALCADTDYQDPESPGGYAPQSPGEGDMGDIAWTV